MSADLIKSESSAHPPGEIPQEQGAFDQFLARNQKYLIILAVLAAIVAAGWAVYRGFQKSHEKAAGEALSKASDTAAIQKISGEFPSTPAAGSAMVLLANREWTDGKQDAAIATLRKFLAEYEAHPARPTAQASLGSKLLQQGKSEEAAKVFEALVKDPTASFLAPYALISLGDIAKAAGDVEKAETHYKKAQEDYTDSSFADAAARRLTILKAKPPVEIEAPPAPAPAPSTDGSAAPPTMLTPFSPQPGFPIESPATTPQDTPAPATGR